MGEWSTRAINVNKLPSNKTFLFDDGQLRVRIVKCQTDRFSDITARSGRKLDAKEAAWLILEREFNPETADRYASAFYREVIRQQSHKWRVTTVKIRIWMVGKRSQAVRG